MRVSKEGIREVVHVCRARTSHTPTDLCQLHTDDALVSYKPTVAQLLQNKKKEKKKRKRSIIARFVHVLTLIPPLST